MSSQIRSQHRDRDGWPRVVLLSVFSELNGANRFYYVSVMSKNSMNVLECIDGRQFHKVNVWKGRGEGACAPLN